MAKGHRRMKRERRTIEVMMGIYCRDQHGTRDALCGECDALLNYALQRLDRCPFQEDKPTCANCSIHCYKPDMHQKVRTVMRYAGPRMVRPHPVLSLFHLIDGRRKASKRSKSR